MLWGAMAVCCQRRQQQGEEGGNDPCRGLGLYESTATKRERGGARPKSKKKRGSNGTNQDAYTPLTHFVFLSQLYFPLIISRPRSSHQSCFHLPHSLLLLVLLHYNLPSLRSRRTRSRSRWGHPTRRHEIGQDFLRRRLVDVRLVAGPDDNAAL